MLVTSCGQVICNKCQPKLAARQCQKCRGPCTRTIPLNEKAPKEVLALFTDTSEQLKAVFKNYNFQETQKKSLLEYKERKVGQMNTHLEELSKKKNLESEMYNKLRENLNYLEKKEADLKEKVNRATLEPSRSLGNGGYKSRGGFGQTQGFFGGGGHSEVSRDRPTVDVVEGLNRSGGRQGGNGFLEMKTPAAWYHKQQRGMGGDVRAVGKSPQQLLMELEASSKRSGGSSNSKGRTPFFTSPNFSPKVTPTRRHY